MLSCACPGGGIDRAHSTRMGLMHSAWNPKTWILASSPVSSCGREQVRTCDTYEDRVARCLKPALCVTTELKTIRALCSRGVRCARTAYTCVVSCPHNKGRTGSGSSEPTRGYQKHAEKNQRRNRQARGSCKRRAACPATSCACASAAATRARAPGRTWLRRTGGLPAVRFRASVNSVSESDGGATGHRGERLRLSEGWAKACRPVRVEV
eukprot:6190889-Pleurochrysis_carterae.AAC.2